MKYEWLKRTGALLAALAVLALAGCGATPDSKEDPLSAYDADSVLPFATRAPIDETPSPSPSPLGTISPIDQGWQQDTPPDGGDASFDNPTPQPQEYVRLEEGATGGAVQRLQQRLIQLGYMAGTPDGQFGGQTKDAVKRVQSMFGLSQTGIASVALQEKLFRSDAPEYEGSLSATPRPTAKPTPKPAKTTAPSKETARPYDTLSQGDSGTAVARMQARLIDLGYLSGAADGDFGSRTTAAVKRFQAALGVAQTGVATGSLQEKMYKKSAPTAKPQPTPTPAYVLLEPGDSGTHVKAVQHRLKQLGYFTGDADGRYLASTTEAVKRFQAVLGLNQTGVATVALQAKLFSASAPTYDAVKPAPTKAPEATGKYSYLKPGSTGQQVVNLQKRLIELGYLTGPADGDYGSATTAAVKRFQAAIGADTTGIATGYLQEKIFAKNAPTRKPAATATPKPSGQYEKLQPGDSNAAVKRMQQRLKDLGYFTGNPAGNYKELTTAAVKRFQAAIGMEATGVATAAMQEVLFSDDAPYYTDASTGNYSDLHPGDSGNAVKRLQARLIELGYMPGSATGNYGSVTVAAVKVFQYAVGMETSGVATVKLQEKLFSSSAPRYVDSEPSDSGSYAVLQLGSSGEEVKNLQKRLQQLGWLPEGSKVITGKFDERTAEALMDFQEFIGTPDELIDGIATEDLQAFLFSESAFQYAKPSD